jgi:hypothetical protein
MSDGLRALLEGAIDYAGLFPPAKLSLDEAIRNYARYLRDADAWMLGRFVLPAARLDELAPYVEELFAAGPPLAVAALGRGSDTAQEWTAGVRADAEAIARCRQRHGDRVRIDVFETRLPDAVLEPAESRSLPTRLRAAAGALGPGPAVFAEGPLLPSHFGLIREGGAGVKLRCGGLTAAAFPPVHQVGSVILACRAAGVPLKLTAGLHHPLPRFDPGVRATMHGFVNVLAAGAFTAGGVTDEQALAALLWDADPTHFSFSDGVAWGGLQASAAEVTRARREAITSFGSCSFDEPRDDLRALGWL